MRLGRDRVTAARKRAAGAAMTRIRRALPVLDLPENLRDCVITPGLIAGFLGEEIPITAVTRAHSITLMLEPPPRTLPIDIGSARPFKCGLGSATKPQSVALPRFPGHADGSMTVGTSSLPLLRSAEQ